MPKYKLIYFDVWGIAEPIRFLLKYSGAEFEDYRIKDKETEWKELKPKTPYGQVPILEIDGKAYAQTIPICHYLAKQINLLGNTDLDALQIDGIATSAFEFRKQATPYFFEQGPKKKQELQDNLREKIVPFYMSRYEKLISENGGYLHGHKLSHADLFLVAILDAIDLAVEKDSTQDYPGVKELRNKVRSLPVINTWLKERPKSVF